MTTSVIFNLVLKSKFINKNMKEPEYLDQFQFETVLGYNRLY